MIPKTAIATYFLAKELHKALSDSTLQKVEYNRDTKTFRFLIHNPSRSHILFSFAPVTFLWLQGWPEIDSAFQIWQELESTTITSVNGFKDNRIIRINCEKHLEGFAPNQYTIVFELFGAQSNAYLLDSAGTIQQAVRVVEDDRELRPGSVYVAPSGIPGVPNQGRAVATQVGKDKYEIEYSGKEYTLVPKPTSKDDYPLAALFARLNRDFHQLQLFESQRKSISTKLKKLAGKQRQLIEQLREQLAETSKADALSKHADLLMGHPHVTPVDGKVTVLDFYTNTNTEIELEPGKTAVESAGILYKRAKRLQRSVAPLNTRIKQADAKLSEYESLLEQLSKIDEPPQLDELVSKNQLATLIAPADSEESGSKYYKTFTTSAGEKLLVGKSSEGNDVLTFKVARTWDLWFHTQQSAGSHVILVLKDKNQKPSKASIEEAARTAAFYSEMRRAANVPIIYTERRYVRKMRKGGPGQVIYQNVKSLFVDPSLPPTATEQD